MPPDIAVSLWLHVVSFVFTALGCAGIWFGRRRWKLANVRKSWPPARGKVLRSYIQQTECADQQGRSMTRYHAKIEYEFFVGGRRFEARRIRFGKAAESERLADVQGIVDRYPAGTSIDVYYDPAQPSLCTLEREISRWEAGVMIGFGLLMIGGGVATLILAHIP